MSQPRSSSAVGERNGTRRGSNLDVGGSTRGGPRAGGQVQAPGRPDEIAKGSTKGLGPFVIVLADFGNTGTRQGQRDVPGKTSRLVHDLCMQRRYVDR